MIHTHFIGTTPPKTGRSLHIDTKRTAQAKRTTIERRDRRKAKRALSLFGRAK